MATYVNEWLKPGRRIYHGDTVRMLTVIQVNVCLQTAPESHVPMEDAKHTESSLDESGR